MAATYRRHALAGLTLIGVSSCLVTTTTHTTRTGTGTDRGAVVAGPLGGPTLQVRTHGATIQVTALRPRTCTRPLYATYDERTTTTIDDESLIPDPYGVGPRSWHDTDEDWLLLPVTIASGVAAVGGAGNESDPVHHREQVTAGRSSCPVPQPDREVVLGLPSGASLTGKTGVDGRLAFVIPDTEPGSGTVTIAVPWLAGRPRTARYHKTLDDCVEDRRDTYARAVAAPLEARRPLLASTPTCRDPRGPAWTRLVTAARDAAGGLCGLVANRADELRALDPELTATLFEAEPDIARCRMLAAGARLRIQDKNDAAGAAGTTAPQAPQAPLPLPAP
jgi:hypothetical protein